MALVNSLRVMLQTTPFHRDNYSRLILSVIIQYYQRCFDCYQEWVTVPSSDGSEAIVAQAALWAQRSELQPCVSELVTDLVCGTLSTTTTFFDLRGL
jgi:exocyst complex component 4